MNKLQPINVNTQTCLQPAFKQKFNGNLWKSYLRFCRRSASFEIQREIVQDVVQSKQPHTSSPAALV